MFERLSQLIDRLAAVRPEDLQATDWPLLLVVLLLSCLSAFLLSFLYTAFFERRSTGTDIHRAFPALAIAITGIFICLQYSLPLSLGLLGALSIVRFRTPIKEPEEIGFLMLLIATSICCATLNFLLLAMLLTLTVGVLCLMRCLPGFLRRRSAVATIVLSAERDRLTEALPGLREILRRLSRGATLDSVTECEGRAIATLSLYTGGAEELIALRRELRERLGTGDISLFVQRPTDL